MPSLAEVQASMRRAVVAGEASTTALELTGGSDPQARLAIHRRHYEASLVTALLTKFPATVWLTGSPLVTEAARLFVRAHPPVGRASPSMAPTSRGISVAVRVPGGYRICVRLPSSSGGWASRRSRWMPRHCRVMPR